jgi:hypothetical protein
MSAPVDRAFGATTQRRSAAAARRDWQPAPPWLSLKVVASSQRRTKAVGTARLAGTAGVLGLAAALFGAAGCAGKGWPAAASAQACDPDPCATMSCPSGFRCSASQQCSPRCDPEPTGNRPF